MSWLGLPYASPRFLAVREMFNRNQPVDSISLADYLKSTGELEKIGGRSYLLGLANNSLALLGWRRHMEMLHRDTTLRKMILASAQITALAYDAPEDTKEVIDRAEKSPSSPRATKRTPGMASERMASISTTLCALPVATTTVFCGSSVLMSIIDVIPF